jgi:signal transduction histidine kinase
MHDAYLIDQEGPEIDPRQEQPRRSFWYSVVLFFVFNSLFLAWLVFKPETREVFVLGDDIAQALGWLLATLFCFVGLRQSWHSISMAKGTSAIMSRRQRWVPLLFALGIFCEFIGQVIYTYYDAHHWEPFPSWADAGYLSTFPFLLLGILRLPLRQLPKITHSRVLLDGLMMMIALITFSWYFVLGPTMLQGNETIFAKIVGSAYPFFDLVLIFCVLRLSFRTDVSTLRPVILLLSIGLTIIVLTDSIYDYQTLQNTYVNGLQDLGWPVGYMLIGLACQALNAIHARPGASAKRNAPADTPKIISSEWNALFPYAFIPAVILLTIYTWCVETNKTLAYGVYIGAASLFGLVLVRQFFAIRETIYYNKELQRMQQELSQKNSDLSNANQQLQEQAAQVAASYEQQRHLNELKDQFLLNVNHELRTPLTEIQGYLELLQEHAGHIDMSLEAKFITLALHGSEELQRLINTILEAIRGSYHEKPPRLEVLPLATVVNEALTLFDPHKWEEYALEINIAATLFVCADREYLHRILRNLLSNAFKYAPKGTKVSVCAQPSTAKCICISVQDAGPGIPAAEMPLLFEKFVRLKRDVAGSIRGTGLGLYICKQLVDVQGGQIWVESSGKDGEGSRFCFTIPATSPVLTEEDEQALPSATEVSASILPSMPPH